MYTKGQCGLSNSTSLSFCYVVYQQGRYKSNGQGDRERRKSSRIVGLLDSALWLADLALTSQDGQSQHWIERADILATDTWPMLLDHLWLGLKHWILCRCLWIFTYKKSVKNKYFINYKSDQSYKNNNKSTTTHWHSRNTVYFMQWVLIKKHSSIVWS